VGSGFGVLFLSFFIRKSWMADAAAGGSWSAWNQFGVQAAGMAATIVLAALGTLIIYFIVEKTIGFRLSEDKEVEGLDQSLHGEHGYGLVGSDVL
jgi:Amt family ammonium transporter